MCEYVAPNSKAAFVRKQQQIQQIQQQQQQQQRQRQQPSAHVEQRLAELERLLAEYGGNMQVVASRYAMNSGSLRQDPQQQKWPMGSATSRFSPSLST